MKESKSAVTIRRRRNRGSNSLAQYLGFRHRLTGTEEDLQDSNSDSDDAAGFNNTDSSLLASPRMIRLILSSQKTLFLSLVAFRLLNALMIQTSYVPDEYWQSTEVAHQLAFGYGYLTWEWHNGLRGYTYPAIFACTYKTLGILHIDSRMFITKVPRLIQGLFAAIGDLFVYRLSYYLSGPQVARWSLLCQLASWFNFYCSTRTLTNSMEAVVTAVGLYYFPWPGRPSRRVSWRYLTMVALAVVVRPTAAITWFPLCLWHLYLTRHSPLRLIKQICLRGVPVFILTFVIDWIFYKRLANIYYNFLEFNFLSDLGSFYGSHPWHWYLSQGLFVVLATHTFPLVLAARKGIEPAFMFVIGWSVLVYSTLSHKEFRFLMGILPLVMHVCGNVFHQYLDGSPAETPVDKPTVVTAVDQDSASIQPTISTQPKSSKKTSKTSSPWKVAAIVILISVNLPLAMYTCLIHQRGTIDVMTFLYAESLKLTKEPISILYLMPCHSTPYYSYIHRNVSMRFLTCEPNLSKLENYTDEADIFYKNPTSWLTDEYFNANVSSDIHPTHLVMFDELHVRTSTTVRTFGSGYEVCGRFFHTHFPEGRVSANVVVMCSMKWTRSVRRYAASNSPLMQKQTRN